MHTSMDLNTCIWPLVYGSSILEPKQHHHIAVCSQLNDEDSPFHIFTVIVSWL